MTKYKEEILVLLKQKKSFRQIAREVGCSKSTVSFHANRVNHVIRFPQCKNRFNWKDVQKYHDMGNSGRGCAKKFGFSSATWTNACRRGDIQPRDRKLTLEDMLVTDRPKTSRGYLKKRLIDEGVFEERCSICGLVDWLGDKLVLELDHINGKNSDNRLENLRLLCPNCHSQTQTYCNKFDFDS